ncbi:hypothetical protein FKW77_003712 [Venturia effusa]|uniref:SEC7 domain-containing protein n=1 Tax=Venturia effusa TaxID=50376 RepID=A0A517L733_9PEZI|nr:hypothetical protein FKW77_003712 [Venturia effusa]
MEMLDQKPADRDSHDLSFTLSRFSVVDSMLSSLSDFPSSAAAGNAHDIYNATTPLKPSSSKNPLPGRRRGHTQSSSMSDCNGASHIDSISSNYTAFHLRNRQNSTFAKHKTARNASIRSVQSGARNRAPESSRHTRGMGPNAQGSNASSVDVDLGATNSMPFTRLPSYTPSRSASFDHSHGERAARSSPEKSSKSRPKIPVPIDYLAFDAAPMPTIPGGPRKKDEPISPAGYPPRSPKKVVPSRKNSVKSTNAKGVRKSRSQALLHDHDIRDQAKQFVQATTTMRNRSSAAPGPGVGALRKAYPSSSPSAPPAQKESRPGFFRRVFGSSKNSEKAVQAQQEEVQRPPSPAAVRPVPGTSSGTRPRTQPDQQHGTASHKDSPPSQPKPPVQGDDPVPPLPLRKAHSSFFRRRKKSISDNAIPPVPPLQLSAQSSYHHAHLNISPPQKSPSNQSLRGAMAQYLSHDMSPNSIGPSPIETFFDSREHQPEESEDSPTIKQAPSEQASLDERALGGRIPDSARQGTSQEDLKRGGDDHPSNTLNQDSEQLQSTVRAGPRLAVNGEIERGSFLINSSSSEAMSQPSPMEMPPHKTLQRQHGTPASDAFGPPQLDQENVASSRKDCYIGAKRTDVQILSPISDKSHMLSDRDERTSRFLEADDEEDEETFIVRHSKVRDEAPPASAGSNRVWLEPTSSDEKLPLAAQMKPPLDSPRATIQSFPTSRALTTKADNGAFASATSLPTVQVGDLELRMSQDWTEMDAAKVLLAHDIETTEGDMRRARQIFDGDEEFVSKAGAAAWLGQTTPKSSRTRRAYMELFDWAGVNILAAFRELCGKLLVKAESQQLDRVIDAFSERWCNCNPNHGFKDRDIVHTITFSILMLNTDLHIADIDQRMTRSQFVKNTLPTIRSMAEAIDIDATETIRAQARDSRGKIPWDHATSGPSSPIFPEPPTSGIMEQRHSIEAKRSSNRLSLRAPMSRLDSDGADGASDNCNVLVKAPFEGTMKGWEFQVEIVLKEFYNSIRQQRLSLHGAPVDRFQSHPSQTGLFVVTNALRRTPSVLSKAPSESVSYRGRSSEAGRFAAGRFASKTRSRPRIYPSSTIGSSRTSLDDSSVWSPAGSTWSKYTLGQTQTSMSVNSLGSHFAQGDYQQAIGFANALSQAIIREEGGSDEYNGRVVPLLEDETLELVGAPWAKEGMLKHKHHLESLEKKAKDRNWSECFAVIEKGWMKIFSFSTTSKSTRARAKSRAASGGGPVGGGNWMENAEQINSFLLRQTIASALPPPGYSKSRPNVFALSLPTGAVHLFQVGTPDIVKEFVSTANYWSARLSKEPLFGSVSNVEYGWGDVVLNAAQSRPESRATLGSGSAPGTSSSNVPVNSGRHSIVSQVSPERQSTGLVSIGRRSEDQGPSGTAWRPRLPGDKVTISDWTPPVQSMMASQLMEIDQLRALTAYVANVEEELKKHNELRSLMGLAFSPRHPNAAKAMANWEKKSAYLLREIVKFRTYIDSLTSAQAAKEKFYKEREELIRKGDEAMQASNTLDPAADNINTITPTPRSKKRARGVKRRIMMHGNSPKRASILDWSSSVFKSATPSISEERESDHEDFETYSTRTRHNANASLGLDLDKLDSFAMRPSPRREKRGHEATKSMPGRLRKRRSTLG